MDEQDRLSQASSVVTISSFPVRPQTGEGKVQTFGKRSYAVKRDPNCPVVIRGWLYKKDSTGLKLWKRRWFVLSEYCLFYYKDSREETVFGSIPLPSYSVLFCTPRECKNRKYTFKVVHQGMRTYFFSADTQEDMLGWVRAISQSASMDTESIINKRCSSYQDFTQVPGSTEFVHIHHNTSNREVQPRQQQTELTQPQTARANFQSENGGTKNVQRSMSSCKGKTDEGSLPFLSVPQYFSSYSQPLSPRGQLDSRPHTPVGRVDIRPHNDLPPIPPSNKQAFGVERLAHKGSVSSQLQPSRPSPNSPNPHCQSLRSHSYFERYDALQGSEIQSSRTLDSHVDAVLTKLCGCDKQLQSLCTELSHLQAEKDNLQAALEVSHIQRDECKYTEAHITQKALVQEDLVTIRARICDVSMDMDYVWCQYERMESELAVFRSQLQHICHYGMPQEQHKAQKQLWMMEDILCGLMDSRNHYRLVLGLQDQQSEEIPGHNLDVEFEAPFVPPLTHELWTTSPKICRTARCDSHIYSKPLSSYQEQKHDNLNQDNKIHTWPPADAAVNVCRVTNTHTKDCGTGKREQKQTEEMKSYKGMAEAHSEATLPKPSDTDRDRSSDLHKSTALPLRLTRVVTATLPSALIAHRVSVQDPPLELLNPLPEQIPQTLPRRAPSKPSRVSSQHTALRPHEESKNEMTALRSVTTAQQMSECISREAPQQNRRSKTPKEQRFDQEVDINVHSSCFNEERREQTSNQTSVLNLCLEQREAKLKRVERIRQRVIRSVSRENHIQTGVAPVNPIQQITELSDSKVQTFGSTSSNSHAGDTEISEKALNSCHDPSKSLNHKIRKNLLAHPSSLPVQNSALTDETCSAVKPSEPTNNRSEWFLSTCEWQGFRALANPGPSYEAELEHLSENSSMTQQNKDLTNEQFSTKELYILGARPRCKENRVQLLTEAFMSQDKKEGMSERLCDMSLLSKSDVMTPAANCRCDGKKNGALTKNENNKFSDHSVASSVSTDKHMTCLPHQLSPELSIYEEIPNVKYSSQREKSKNDNDDNLQEQEFKNKCGEAVTDDIVPEKKEYPQSETVSCIPENDQSQIQLFMNGVENHSPSFVWSKVTMDSTSV